MDKYKNMKEYRQRLRAQGMRPVCVFITPEAQDAIKNVKPQDQSLGAFISEALAAYARVRSP